MIDAVATVLGVQENVFAAAAVENSVGKGIRQQTLANIDIRINIIYRINGQVQRHGAVAAQNGLECEVVVVLYIVRSVVVFIYIAFADFCVKVGVFARIDGQSQCDNAVTTVYRASVEYVVAANGSHFEYGVTPGVWQFILTNDDVLILCVRWVNGQGQCDDTVTTVYSASVEYIVAAYSFLFKDCVTPDIRQLVLTNNGAFALCE